MTTMLILTGSVFFVSLIAVILMLTFDTARFEDEQYHPKCFDCNLGNESCPTCPYFEEEVALKMYGYKPKEV